MENNNINEQIEIKETITITKEDNSKKDNYKTIASAIIVLGILVAGAILLKGTKPTANPQRQENNAILNQEEEISLRPVTEEDHILGNKNAKIKIVEYSDTGCPFCRIFHTTMHKIVTESNGEVAWVYRHFPIESLHPNAFSEAIATECAYEQGGNEMFWAFTDEIYKRTKSNNTFTSEDINQIAEDLNLTMYAFNDCVENQVYKNKVEQDIIDGQIAGVQGTPSSFIVIDGKVIDTIGGAAPYESLKQALDLLSKKY
ncbi:MAG: thioredoxin domain-containing protein [Candidatus Pacebacteria bacterium]|nr:thioredoxin domain-containing protein [Candidatus Paceibacterota bacterium]